MSVEQTFIALGASDILYIIKLPACLSPCFFETFIVSVCSVNIHYYYYCYYCYC